MKYGVGIAAVLLLVSVLLVGSVGVAGQGPAGAAAHWAFEEQTQWSGAANEVKDSADGAHGSAKGGAERVGNQEGRPGSVASFDGVDDYIEVPNSAALLPATNAITVAGWLKINSVGKPGKDITGTMMSKRESYILSPNAADRSVCFYVNIGGANPWKVVCAPAGTLQTGFWQHIAGVYDSNANTLSIYVDGTFKNKETVSGNIQASSEPLCIGKDYCSGTGDIQNRYLDGAVDDVFIYGRALSVEEIRVLRQPPVAAGACAINDKNPIFALSGESNAHAYPGSSTLTGAYKVCFGKAFPNTVQPGDLDVYKCKGDATKPSNVVLYVSDKTGNAHAAVPKKTPPVDYAALCYGDMDCRAYNIADGACPTGTTLIAALSAEGNAHLSGSASAAYPQQICCSPKAGPKITAVEWHLAAAATDEASMLAENKIPDTTKDSTLSFTPEETSVRIYVKTTGVDIATLKNLKITLREVDISKKETPGATRIVDDDPITDESDDELGAVTLSNPTFEVDVNNIGRAVFTWKLEDKKPGLGNAYASSGNDEKTIKDRFEFVATAKPPAGSTLSTFESVILYAQTGKWVCNEPERTSATLWQEGKPTLRTLTESTRATDKNLAGQACKGPDGRTADEQTGEAVGVNRDNCCPANMKCTSQGCVPVGITQCQDYSIDRECKADAANLWRNKPAFVVLNSCGEKTTYQQACQWWTLEQAQKDRVSWDALSTGAQDKIKKQGGKCDYAVNQLLSSAQKGKKVGYQVAQCTYYYDEKGDCDADNYRLVNVLATKVDLNDPTYADCSQPEKDCKGGEQRIPCGQPAFQLPFFGAWQAVGAVALIAILYLAMFHFKAVRKWIGIRKGVR